jgi:hypothetical protein
MRNVGLKSWYAAIGVLALVLSVGSPLLASPPPTFYLTGVNSSAQLDGVYTSPYYGTTVLNGTPVPVICDDFGDNSFIPEDWSVYVTSLSSVPSSGDDKTLKWAGAGSDTGLTQVQAYTVAAYLDLEILNAPAASTQQEELSYALWDLFDPTVLAGQAEANWGSPCAVSGCINDAVQPWLGPSTTLTHVEGDVTAAIAAVTGNPSIMSGYNVTIYSYDAPNPSDGVNVPAGNGIVPTCGSGTCSTLPPQEFITVTAVPEASSLAMFAAYLLLGGGSLLFFGRRRMLRNR